jgi:hypothetical protein
VPASLCDATCSSAGRGMADGLLVYWACPRFLGVPLKVPVDDMV